ncbi:hypothetical protein EOD23_34105 [Mesorhizobium sp. USDA-HM6]|nr:hypothetical protein EOD23_34105 [Mesorhizobium sp. USDA-HM6]
MTNFKRIALAAALVVSAFGSVSGPAFAGILPSNDGAVCKGQGPCSQLKANCKGTYVDATDSSGTVYGKCRPASAQVNPKSKIKLAR